MATSTPHEGAPMSDDEQSLEPLLDYVRDARAFDFTGYKRASLMRRIRKRMQEVGSDSFGSYQLVLESDANEFASLFDTILINVTSFFRDRDPWTYLADSVIPRLLSNHPDDAPIRLWSTGCASGEETYSLAILFCDAVGEDAFRNRVKIYGTDADNDALKTARHARYPASAIEGAITADRIVRYFERIDDHYVFRSDLRRSVIFGRHDLVMDPPISRVDLLSCRNTLMYFTSDTQRRILGQFHFALSPGGFLLLGKSEALVTRTNLFRVDDLRRHVFQKDGTSRPALTPVPTRPVGAVQPTARLLDGA